jgi:lysyl-tRNA synthetase class 1
VTIEPCGKDLSTAGGSRDRSDAIAREVFEQEPPLNVPYEFLNIGGRKMSTSKGRGASAHSIAEVIPPEQLRFLFLRPRPNQAIEFDPDGTDAIPRLFDEFDRFAAATAGRAVKGELTPGYEATFRYSLLDPAADVAAEAAAFRPAFSHLALLLQIPGVDVAERVQAEKGSALTDHERTILDQRVASARSWLDGYAPERARLAVWETLPPETADLEADQRALLSGLADTVTQASPSGGDAWQAAIFAAAAEADLPAGRAFSALYQAFLGRTNGPRAGWLLAGLEPSFVIGRLREAAGSALAAATERGRS